jgi:hypothetical protein
MAEKTARYAATAVAVVAVDYCRCIVPPATPELKLLLTSSCPFFCLNFFIRSYQSQTGVSEEARFVLELEFIQCLASPQYLNCRSHTP